MDAKTTERLRARLSELLARDPRIHMDVMQSHPRMELHDAEATLCGVYPHIFRIEETSSGEKRCHTIPYTELLIGHVVVRELHR